MRNRFVIGSNALFKESNIYAEKSSTVLAWLLLTGIEKEQFSLREVSRDTRVSLGLVQRIFKTLTQYGFLQTEGVRTSKRFILKKPKLLFKSWLNHYDIRKKCRMWTYQTSLEGRVEVLHFLKEFALSKKVAFALHTAAEMYRCKNTNLETVELYMLDLAIRPKLESCLQLEPQERGYEVLLIEPYYKNLLEPQNDVNISSTMLTYLDLYHFPLRGQEQAEFMAERFPELKKIYGGK
ncbi:MAG: type IV toxin-antitoxin system AbiEi family antitoxin [Candidatus Algichlamydia australiensis]|nr:type IV toxin-antitoxin system AbiEi family antitoxin [Chlamydiales bacterium]